MSLPRDDVDAIRLLFLCILTERSNDLLMRSIWVLIASHYTDSGDVVLWQKGWARWTGPSKRQATWGQAQAQSQAQAQVQDIQVQDRRGLAAGLRP